MQSTISYRQAIESDLDKIVELLEKLSLPTTDLKASAVDFIIAESETGELAGCIGLEQYGAEGLLRSLAVEPGYRNLGIANELLTRLYALSKEKGVTKLHLLTTTADSYFKARRFTVSERAGAPGSILSTAEFSSLCPSSSVYMTYKLIF
ncbi:MAG: GNAT family N-acetyltransferase [Bacteroidetes bacterium]|nr:GNAT family N-acetyltransferase [Bacteroidota bacterium]